jgi:hypothetical protein
VALEWLLSASVAVLVLKALGVGRSGYLGVLAMMLLAGGVTALAVAGARRPPPPSPIRGGGEGFVSSGACRSCHPVEHASWHASFHRSMTQSATLENVPAPLLRQGGRLQTQSEERNIELFARGRELWARLPDPSLTAAASTSAYAGVFRAAPETDVRVQLLTGSHHQQTYWVSGARAGELTVLPAVYLIAEQRLIPRRDAFLSPPDAAQHAVRWNSNCIQCHAVGGAPGHDLARDVFDSSAAELGIACEACHGPGAAHVKAMQNPLARYAARAADAAPQGVVNPLRMTAARASEVCGRCHSYFFPKRPDEWWQHGFTRSYLPGEELSSSQLLLTRELLGTPEAPSLDESAESLFYQDGTIRVAGREYNGLKLSPCFERGVGERQLSCLSCHSLHGGAPNDQLTPDKLDNAACATCHAGQQARLSEHTGHAPNSSGSLCYNCHMPHTTYALLGAVRSHRIDSPSFDERSRDKPNACNLCHLEQSEAWAAERAAKLFGDKPPYRLSARRDPALASLPAGAVFALTGDAAVRAVTAAALGRHESPSSPELRRQLLGELQHDPYSAVRFIAKRSLASLPAMAAPVTPPLTSEQVERLRLLRDDRPVTIAE